MFRLLLRIFIVYLLISSPCWTVLCPLWLLTLRWFTSRGRPRRLVGRWWIMSLNMMTFFRSLFSVQDWVMLYWSSAYEDFFLKIVKSAIVLKNDTRIPPPRIKILVYPPHKKGIYNQQEYLLKNDSRTTTPIKKGLDTPESMFSD